VEVCLAPRQCHERDAVWRFCHQQVQSTHFADFWAPELGKAGYTAIFKKKTGEVGQRKTTAAHCHSGCVILCFLRKQCGQQQMSRINGAE